MRYRAWANVLIGHTAVPNTPFAGVTRTSLNEATRGARAGLEVTVGGAASLLRAIGVTIRSIRSEGQ